ncbi:calpain-like cysteine peptidase [Strigomonas culicis]|uniref:Calpain-like cysteine peptidase n=1 Tax=Strigomonas culicis TaxID=28005 RepID=S9U5J1_9TRYP|nr:calpain-like cysteine peptidase [Strigomonas culicis]|eukprot:EPY24019.1 calpain-like cysteine peptidase [Strigomonas culicis]
MNVSGCWRSIIVDNYLPILGNQPRFARSAKDPCELWVSMMEKAYAKRSKAYSNMASGDPLLAIRDLTGFPTCRLDAKFQESVADRAQSDAFFDRLLACCENGHLILFSTPGSSDGRSKSPRYAENGVLIGYAYGVLRVARVGDERLVQLRDPWASGAHWKGRWAPGADAWARCPAAGPCFPQHGPQDASFVLDWEEACRFFVGCGVVFNHYHYIDYRIPFVFQGGVAGLCLEVAVTEPTALTVVLSQADRRGSRTHEAYAPIMLSLARQTAPDTAAYTLIANSAADLEVLGQDFTFLQGRDIYLMYTFLPEHSPYLVVPRRLVQPGDGPALPCVLGVLSQLPFTPYGQVQVRLKKLSDENSVFHNATTFTNDAADVTMSFQIKKNAATLTEVTSSTLN